MTTHSQITSPDARAARRQTLVDRWTEYLADLNVPYAAEKARGLRDIMDELGFHLPAALEDAAPRSVTPAGDDSPGRREFRAERERLAARARNRDT